MGTIYSVACKECKVTRNLDKLYGLRKVENREDALKFSEYLENKEFLFRESLLLSFMAEHTGHECLFFNEHTECAQVFDPFYDNEYKDDTDFWRDH